MSKEPVYQRDAKMFPDTEFEPGELAFLVEGNAGRVLDPRRTPVTITAIHPESGMFVVRLDAFEDKGALWEVPFEKVSNYQFGRGSKQADTGTVARYRVLRERFNQPLKIVAEPETRAETLANLASLNRKTTEWLAEHSEFLKSGRSLPKLRTRMGEALLWKDLQGYMEDKQLWEMECAFARQFVSNPYSGEMVKGHRIVLAELGLVSFSGKRVRDAGLFEGIWTKERRGAHIVHRLSFVQSVLRHLGHDTLDVFRGISCEGPLLPAENKTFVSATLDKEVARAHFESSSLKPGKAKAKPGRVLMRRTVPIERIFMTYYETEPMNRHYREAEVVLLFEEGDSAF